MITSKPLSFFKTAKQVREQFNEAEDRRLGESMKAHGQLQPVGARPDGTLLWGERRFRAAHLVGLKELQVIVTDRPLPDAEIRIIQLVENMHRADLTAYEKWLACSELLAMNPGKQFKDLAADLCMDASSVTRLLSPSRCSPAWQEALKAGQVGISDCYAASKLPESEQAGLLAMKLRGASRDQIEKAGRKARKSATGQAVNVSRVKIAMPEATLVITGKKLSMAEVVELLSEALKEARKAADQFDVKTCVSMMRDKAKAG